jgi:hypothetical protein
MVEYPLATSGLRSLTFGRLAGTAIAESLDQSLLHGEVYCEILEIPIGEVTATSVEGPLRGIRMMVRTYRRSGIE